LPVVLHRLVSLLQFVLCLRFTSIENKYATGRTGVTVADDACQNEAKAAGISTYVGGRMMIGIDQYKAWISSNSVC
jgi:hypothetical protein